MRLVKLLLLVFVLSFLLMGFIYIFPSKVNALSCASPTPTLEETFQSVDYVFLGSLTPETYFEGTSPDAEKRAIELAKISNIDRVWKGDVNEIRSKTYRFNIWALAYEGRYIMLAKKSLTEDGIAFPVLCQTSLVQVQNLSDAHDIIQKLNVYSEKYNTETYEAKDDIFTKTYVVYTTAVAIPALIVLGVIIKRRKELEIKST